MAGALCLAAVHAADPVQIRNPVAVPGKAQPYIGGVNFTVSGAETLEIWRSDDGIAVSCGVGACAAGLRIDVQARDGRHEVRVLQTTYGGVAVQAGPNNYTTVAGFTSAGPQKPLLKTGPAGFLLKDPVLPFPAVSGSAIVKALQHQFRASPAALRDRASENKLLDAAATCGSSGNRNCDVYVDKVMLQIQVLVGGRWVSLDPVTVTYGYGC